MIRPLHVLDTDQFAGTEQHVLSLAAAQVREGQQPGVACRRGCGLFERANVLAGVEVVELSGALSSVRAIAGLVRTAGTAAGRGGPQPFNLLHAHNGRSLLASVLTGAARGLPVVMTQHFLEPAHTSRRGVPRLMFNAAHRVCALGTDQSIAISALVRDRMISRGECSADRLTVVHNGVADPQSRVHRLPEQVRAELGIGLQAPLIVTAARLEVEKRVDVLVRAMGRLRATHENVVCVIAGEGSLHGVLQEQIAAAGLQSHVRLLGFRNDVAEIINASDAFVLPSPAEPFGLVLLEAMGLGKAVIACSAGGPLEIVEPGVSGWLVPPLDDHALADALLKILDDPAARARVATAARQRYELEFTDEQMAHATTLVYRKAARRS